MQLSTRIVMTGAAFAALAAPAAAQSIDLTVTIPRLSVAEYHRPYVAIWLEKLITFDPALNCGRNA